MGAFEKTMIDGKPFVLVPEEEFEDMIDTINANAIMARVAAGEETWPAELVYALMETDSRVRTYRTYRNMTIDDLAQAAGIPTSELADIESGKTTGSIDAMTRIAAALRIDLDDLVFEVDDQ
jgi:DNA-binding XRE family transcriptional regulator